jgi:hypothetical protein
MLKTRDQEKQGRPSQMDLSQKKKLILIFGVLHTYSSRQWVSTKFLTHKNEMKFLAHKNETRLLEMVRKCVENMLL